MKAFVLSFFLLSPFICFSQDPPNASEALEKVIDQMMMSNEMQDSIKKEILLKLGMQKDSKSLDNIFEQAFSQENIDSIKNNLPSNKAIKEHQEKIGEMIKNEIQKNAYKADPTSPNPLQDMALGRTVKLGNSGTTVFEYALDRKEILLQATKAARAISFEENQKNYAWQRASEPRFNGQEIPEDYDYDAMPVYPPGFLERLQNGENPDSLYKEIGYPTPVHSTPNVNPFTGGSTEKEKEMIAISWQDIKANLPPNSAAIEFIETKGHPDWGDKNLMLASVLRFDIDAPLLVDLGEVKILDSLITTSKDLGVNDFYKRGGIALGSNSKPGKAIYEKVWSAIDSLLEDVNKVYYAPDGVLHQLAFAALQDESKNYLCNKYDLHLLGTTRTLVEGIRDIYPPKETCWMIIGGISYRNFPGMPSKSKSQPCAAVMDSLRVPYTFTRDKFGEHKIIDTPLAPLNVLDELEGTRQEVSVISRLLSEQGISFQSFSNHNAPEEYFKRLGRNFPDPGVLHIGTHGFYSEEEKEKPKKHKPRERLPTPSPLARSGVYLSGAAHKKHFGAPFRDREDGFWTAEEIAGQNLTNTELVVLSACNSGRGDINLREGVYGLQRAFKIAGVDKMIVSLWEISDDGTAVFMEKFYTYWLSNTTAFEAFQKAQKEMQQHPRYNTPYYWAGFVLLE